MSDVNQNEPSEKEQSENPIPNTEAENKSPEETTQTPSEIEAETEDYPEISTP